MRETIRKKISAFEEMRSQLGLLLEKFLWARTVARKFQWELWRKRQSGEKTDLCSEIEVKSYSLDSVSPSHVTAKFNCLSEVSITIGGNMKPVMSQTLKDKLFKIGVQTSVGAGGSPYPLESQFEAPCNTQWIDIQHSFAIGAFSYTVSGYFFACRIGRYCSIGENVQLGRGNHPITWLSTNPVFYHKKLFTPGSSFGWAPDLDAYEPEMQNTAPLPFVQNVDIGNDVWIGHGSFIRPGVKIGDGAIIAAMSVVTKDVPPYSVVAGNPAVVKKYRFPEEIRNRLALSRWWRLAPWQLRGIDVSRPESSIDAIERRVSGTPAFEPGLIKFRDLVE
ncbi:CatB-related O-acetyltransferase [Agrobacterium vitis]